MRLLSYSEREEMVLSNIIDYPRSLFKKTDIKLSQIENQESLTFKTDADAPVDIDASSNKTEKRKKIKNKKQKKKASGSRFDGKNFDVDFTDEGYPLALFQTGGAWRVNRYTLTFVGALW